MNLSLQVDEGKRALSQALMQALESDASSTNGTLSQVQFVELVATTFNDNDSVMVQDTLTE